MRVQDKAPMDERILRTADRLFYQRGIRAVGVDTVAAEAGISKRSLYDYFPSKEALIVAYLARQGRAHPISDAPPAQQVLAVFDRLRAMFEEEGFRGCPFVNGIAELGHDCAQAREIAVRFKEGRIAWFRDQLARAGAPDPDGLAVQMTLLVEGAIAAMLVREDPTVADAARDAARVLLIAAGISLDG